MEKTRTLKTATAICFCVRKCTGVKPPTVENVTFTAENVESSFAAKGTPPTRKRICSDGYILTIEKYVADYTLTTKFMIVSPGVSFLIKWSIV